MKLFKIKKTKIKGFVYIPDEDNDLFAKAKIGDSIIKQNREPPYIVVDHSLNTKIITQWPGKLYYVEVINQRKEKDINKGLVKNVWYTRTLGVKILEEVPLEAMFGENGKSIKNLIDLTRNIETEQVEMLSKYDVRSNRSVVDKAWKKWIRLTDKDYSFLPEDYSNTLNMSPKNQVHGSPIGEGLSIIASQFDIRARELVGDAAFGVDEDGEIFLQPTWSTAVEALLQAGISYESDGLISEAEKQSLRKPVKEVFH